MLARIRRWARTTRRGDLAEVRGLSDSHPVWAQVTSTRESCLGMRCPEISRCHVALARREAFDADIVIVNHHLLLADLALKEDGFGDLLGSADAVILDEAHQIPDLATQFFGAHVSSRQLELLLRDLALELSKHAQLAGAAAVEAARVQRPLESLRAADEALRDLRSACAGAPGRRPWSPDGSVASRAVHALIGSLEELPGALAGAGAEEHGALALLGGRAAELAASLARIAAVDELEGARTLEVTARGLTLSLMPFDISERFRASIRARNRSEMSNGMRLSVKPRAVTSSVRAPSSSSTAAIRARLAASSAARPPRSASAPCSSAPAPARAPGSSSSDPIRACTARLATEPSGLHGRLPGAPAQALRRSRRASSAARSDSSGRCTLAASTGAAPASCACFESSRARSLRSNSR